MRKELKTFFGGITIGLLTGAVVGGFVVALIGATAFINYEIAKDANLLGQATTTLERTNK
jgi:hypothetical protein